MKRRAALTLARVAGYHRDADAFRRVLTEARVDRDHLDAEWVIGAKAKAAGIGCDCAECRLLHTVPRRMPS